MKIDPHTAAYLRELGRHPLLEPEEEVEKFCEIKKVEPAFLAACNLEDKYTDRVEALIHWMEKPSSTKSGRSKNINTQNRQIPIRETAVEKSHKKFDRAHSRFREKANRLESGDSSTKPLTIGEVKSHYQNLLDEVVVRNLRLVISEAKKFHQSPAAQNVELEDLVESGIPGLIGAARRFDPYRKIKFSTYAVPPIRWAIMNALPDLRSGLSDTTGLDGSVGKIELLEQELMQELEQKPSWDAILEAADKKGWKTSLFQRAAHAKRARAPFVSLDARRVIHNGDGGNEGGTFGDCLSDKAQTATQIVEDQETIKRMKDNLWGLGKREQVVIRLRFGLDDEEPKTLKEIGEMLGITRERIRQIENEALEKLKTGLTGE